MDTETSFEIITLKNPSDQPFPVVYNNHVYRTIPPGMAMRLPKKPFGLLAEKHLIDLMCNISKQPTGDPAIRAKWRQVIVIDEDVENTDQPIDPSVVLQQKLDRINGTNESNQVKECPECKIKVFSLVEHNALNHAPDPTTPATTPELPPTNPTPAAVNPGASAPAPGYVPQPNPLPAGPTPVLDGTAGLGMPPAEKPAPTTDAQKDVASLVNGVTKKAETMTLPEQTIEDEPPANYAVDPNPTREQLIAHARSIGMNVDEPKTKAFLDTADIETLKSELSYGI